MSIEQELWLTSSDFAHIRWSSYESDFWVDNLNGLRNRWLGVNPSVGLDGNLMACPLCPGNSLDPLGYHCVTCKIEVVMSLWGIMLYVICSSILSVELACHHILKLVVAGARTAQGPSSRHPCHQLGQRHLSSLRCHCYISAQFYSVIVEAGMYSGVAARAAELGNILKMTQNVLHWVGNVFHWQ